MSAYHRGPYEYRTRKTPAIILPRHLRRLERLSGVRPAPLPVVFSCILHRGLPGIAQSRIGTGFHAGSRLTPPGRVLGGMPDPGPVQNGPPWRLDAFVWAGLFTSSHFTPRHQDTKTLVLPGASQAVLCLAAQASRLHSCLPGDMVDAVDAVDGNARATWLYSAPRMQPVSPTSPASFGRHRRCRM
jgi:hypothetical protein